MTMIDKIAAPWTPDQVDALNRFQRAGLRVHPFTCVTSHGGADRALVATHNGWICPHCGYLQDWALAGMPAGGDLVARLRKHANVISADVTGEDGYWPEIGLMREAAGAIEQLQAWQRARLEQHDMMNAEIGRLRTARAEAIEECAPKPREPAG
jgi:hypothetical protein